MILILDTDVVVAALRSPGGASRRLIQRLRAGRVKAIATISMFVEYEAVLTRPENLAATGLSSVDVGGFSGWLGRSHRSGEAPLPVVAAIA